MHEMIEGCIKYGIHMHWGNIVHGVRCEIMDFSGLQTKNGLKSVKISDFGVSCDPRGGKSHCGAILINS